MLAISEISKSFGATRAVNAVSIDVEPGTVLGLVGENGAGKSTLLRIISGATGSDSGTVRLDGASIKPNNIHDALDLGIASVFQELTLIHELSVEQNLMLTSPPLTPWRSIDRRAMRRQAGRILERYKLHIAPAARVADLPLGQQQMIEIVRAIERNPKVLLLDEATSALGGTEVQWLHELVERFRRENRIVLFISHRWDEIVKFCSHVAVLRNGELMATSPIAELDESEAVRLMTGRQNFEDAFPDKSLPMNPKVLLSARGLRSDALHGVDIELNQGEILGIGGLVGQGQGELLRSFFGAHDLKGGEIRIDGADAGSLTPRRAIAAGFAYVPQERKSEGLLLDKSVGQNMTLAILDRLQAAFSHIPPRREAELVTEGITRARVRTRSRHEPVRNLSGGNQQKVLLEKWLLTRPRVLLLNDVTRGVDIGTKHQIYETIAAFAGEGAGVIWYSTDVRELVGLAHRVVVMLRGEISAELTGTGMQPDNIVRAAVMGARSAEPTGAVQQWRS